jgi:hypothetical protein
MGNLTAQVLQLAAPLAKCITYVVIREPISRPEIGE